MEDFERKLNRTIAKRRKVKRLGIKYEVCPICGNDDVSNFQFDHIAGRKHHPQTWPLCTEHHEERNLMQAEQPKTSENPKNPLEVIGRWLLGMAEHFEMLIRYLRQYGEFLIGLASEGYGAELQLPT